MRQLEKTFVGKGQVKGFLFTQLKKTEFAYLYEVDNGSNKAFEIFKHRENTRFGCVTYPSNKAFGIWAKTTRDFQRALDLFDLYNVQPTVNEIK
jgi:hypothetical protein